MATRCAPVATRPGRVRSRGAAMVEAVIVIPVMIVLFASLVYMWRVYRAKIATMAATRAALWTYAQTTNCGQPGDPSKGYSAAGTPAPPGIGGGSGQESATHLSSQLGTASLTTSSAVVEPAALGGAGVTAKAPLALMCNEPPYDADLLSLAKAAYHDVTNW